MKIDIIDNFIASYHVNTLVRTFNGKQEGKHLFPFLFLNDLNGDEYLGNYYFSKTIINDFEILDPYWMPIFNPLLARLSCQPSAVLRLKVNLYPRTQRRVHHSPHMDYQPDLGFRTCLYYVNTNNGFTKFDGTFKSVKSKKNRAIFFDGSNKHHSTTPTDCNYRCSINIDYNGKRV